MCYIVIESHSETAPSLRIDKAFPALLEYSLALDFNAMDPTDHGHVPYVIILVRALDDWKKSVSSFTSLIKRFHNDKRSSHSMMENLRKHILRRRPSKRGF